MNCWNWPTKKDMAEGLGRLDKEFDRLCYKWTEREKAMVLFLEKKERGRSEVFLMWPIKGRRFYLLKVGEFSQVAGLQIRNFNANNGQVRFEVITSSDFTVYKRLSLHKKENGLLELSF